ncbi:hypothetical protein TWF694_004398 [Orbilia ellipsospora]|uniref:RNase III domain-containing protein n=1 Tax=Orbilia ellipsospora TaxID=2528407 RepID=A0AAV9WVA3_9PEZI
MVNQVKIQSLMEYKFNNDSLLTEALEAAGRANYTETISGMDGNKRLALLGDALLQLVYLDRWYPSGRDREYASDELQKFTCNKNLQKCAEELTITSEILPNAAQQPLERVPKTTAASTMEALLGAVWLDSNKDFEQVKKAAVNLEILEDIS